MLDPHMRTPLSRLYRLSRCLVRQGSCHQEGQGQADVPPVPRKKKECGAGACSQNSESFIVTAAPADIAPHANIARHTSRTACHTSEGQRG